MREILITGRNMAKEPYSADEQRVVAYLANRGLGGGPDPIGFILASHSEAISERNKLRRQVERLRMRTGETTR